MESLSALARQERSLCRFLEQPDQAIRPALEATPFDWAIVLPPQTRLQELDLRTAIPEMAELEITSQFLNFNWQDQLLRLELFHPILLKDLVLEGSLRDAKVAARLKESRKGLNRFRKLLTGLPYLKQEHLPSADLKGHLLNPQHPIPAFTSSERKVLQANTWLQRQWESREQPWSAEGLAQIIQAFLKSLTRCWETLPIDGGENTGALLLRIAFWDQQAWLIGQVLERLRP